MSSEEKPDYEEMFRNMTLGQLLDWETEHDEERDEGIPDWLDAWMESLEERWPFESIYEKLKALETTVSVLVKELGGNSSEITIGQLIRLKGGHY